MTIKKSFLECCQVTDIIKQVGNDVEISSLQYDSRRVEKGALFFALPGLHTNGAEFISSAISNGAVAVIHQKELAEYKPGICYIQVPNARKAMAPVAAHFYDYPSKKLKILGVTGTEGKSSTVSFIWQLLNLANRKAGYFSTVSYAYGKEEKPNPEHQTTPEAITVQKHLYNMLQAGCEFAIVEASSHGLSALTGRLDEVLFDAGVFLNVTQEHLEFHGTFEQYRSDKANLFRSLRSHNKKGAGTPPFAVVNLDDPSAGYFIDASDVLTFGFGIRDKRIFNKFNVHNFAGGIFADNITETEKGISFRLIEFYNSEIASHINASIPLAGRFNVNNILASLISVTNLLACDVTDVVPLFEKLKPIAGRMTMINEGQDFEVLIDYAHTPSSFETIFPSIHNRIKANGKKVIAVFGSGGERDTQKRPEQGRIAGKYSDIIILADEDPRGEDRVELLEMIAKGCPEKKRNEDLFIIPDRPQAIRKAFSLASAGDAVLLLGKGHENSIIFKDKAMPYDEETEARTALKELK